MGILRCVHLLVEGRLKYFMNVRMSLLFGRLDFFGRPSIVSERLAGSNTFCDLDPRCFGDLGVVLQAAKKKGGRNVKSKQV